MKKFLLFSLLICFFITPLNFSEGADFIGKNNEEFSQIFQLDVNKLQYEQRQLVYAILLGNERNIRTILDSDDNPKTTYSKLPLTLYAVYADQLKSLKLLIEYGFDPNQAFIGVDAMDIAVFLKRYEHIEYLLSIGVVPKPEDIDIAKKSKDKKLIELLN